MGLGLPARAHRPLPPLLPQTARLPPRERAEEASLRAGLLVLEKHPEIGSFDAVLAATASVLVLRRSLIARAEIYVDEHAMGAFPQRLGLHCGQAGGDGLAMTPAAVRSRTIDGTSAS